MIGYREVVVDFLTVAEVETNEGKRVVVVVVFVGAEGS